MSLQALRSFSENLGLGRLKPTREELEASVPGGAVREGVREDQEVFTAREKELLESGEALPKTLSPTQQTKPKEEEEEDKPGFWSEIFWGVPRGLRDAAQGVLSLGDAAVEGLGGNLMPDRWHESDWMLGEATTVAGSLSSGIVQFATGFVPAFKVASMAGKASKARKASKIRVKANKADKVDRTKAREQARAEIQALRVKKPANIRKGIAAGAVADFSVFQPNQERLADLLGEHAGLNDPFTNFLKYEGNEDDPEYLGRLKNVAEGLVIEGVVGGAIGVAVLGLKKLRNPEGVVKGLSDAEAEVIEGVQNPWTTASRTKKKEPKADGINAGDDAAPRSEGFIGKEEKEYIKKARDLEIPLMAKDGTIKSPGRLKLEVDKALGDKAYRDSPFTSKSIVYHGGKLKDPDKHGGILFTTKSKKEAEDFAKANQGFDEFTLEIPTNSYLIDPKTIAGEFEGVNVLRELNLKPLNKDKSLNNSTLNDLLDSTSDSYIGDKGRTSFIKAMKEKGFKGVEAGGGTKKVEDNIALFETPKKTVKEEATINAAEFDEAVNSNIPKGRGGDIALESSTIKNLLGGTTDTASLWNVLRVVMRNVQSDHSVITKFDKSTHKEIVTFVNDNPDTFGNLEDAIKNSSDKDIIEAANDELVKSVVIYKFMREAAEESVRLARRHIADPLNKEDYLDFIDMFGKYGELARINSLRGSVASGALMQRKFLKQGMGGIDNNALRPLSLKNEASGSPMEAVVENEEYLQAFLEKLGTTDTVTLAKRLDMIANFDEFQRITSLGELSKMAQHTLGRKVLDVSKEIYINSLLGNPATQVVNSAGSLLTNVISTMERTVGSLLRGNIDLAKSTLRHQYSLSTLWRAIRAMGNSAFKDSSILVPGKAQYLEQKAYKRSFSTQNNSVVGKAINHLGALVNLPSRALVSVDEFFKQLAYTGYVKGELSVKYLDQYKAAIDASDAKALSNLGVKFDADNLGNNNFTKWLNEKVETEFQKHLTSDGAFYSEKNRMIAAQKHLTRTGKLFGEGREEALQKYLNENPFQKEASNLANSAQKMANQLTFTNDVSDISPWFKRLENLMRTAPGPLGFASTLLIPFYRTPLNILAFAVDRSPIGAVLQLTKRTKKKYRKALKEGTETDRSQAMGKLATGATVGYMWQQIIDSAGDKITGGGPQNKQERDALRATGWQPYSYKRGDTYYSYQRLDPVATLIGISADWRDYKQYDEDPNEGIGANILLIFAENLSDKTFLQGVNNAVNLMEDPEYYGPKLFRDVASGFVPNSINHFKNSDAQIIVNETRDLTDAIYKKLPGFVDQVAPKRTVLGDIVYRENPLGTTAFNPIYKSTDKKDVVANEMARTQHGFSMPGKKFYGIPEIDLTEIPVEGKFDAYDRYLELSGTLKIGGKTMKQRLKSLIQSKAYQRLPEEVDYDATGRKSQRIKQINNVINAYRSRARYDLLKELPQLRELFDGAMAARRAIGTSPSS
tara:strand:+ start:3987 stop:8426 length:4440 start_codon:yes stop_codon:yes gene_type:complete